MGKDGSARNVSCPDAKIPKFGLRRPRDPNNQIPRVRFTKIRPGGRSGDLNRTDLRPYLGLAQIGPRARAPGSGPRARGPRPKALAPGPWPRAGPVTTWITVWCMQCCVLAVFLGAQGPQTSAGNRIRDQGAFVHRPGGDNRTDVQAMSSFLLST